MKDPQTVKEFEAALEALGVEIEERYENRWIAHSGTSTTALENEDYPSALMEAWNLYKP
jgi:hypothetical protein